MEDVGQMATRLACGGEIASSYHTSLTLIAKLAYPGSIAIDLAWSWFAAKDFSACHFRGIVVRSSSLLFASFMEVPDVRFAKG